MSRKIARALATVRGALPGGGEARAGQKTMADAVAGALESGRHLVVQAGTGTGKSLGYLVPVVCSGKKVVVATATKALQDQLATKDLPLVQQAISRGVRFAVLKGRANYVCRQRLAETLAAPSLEASGVEAAARGTQVRHLLAWAETTETGDRAELEHEPEPTVWASLSVTADECPGATRCPAGEECFAEAARARAAAADIVVVNLHLLGADVAADGMVLPPHDALIVDEAHELEDVMSESLGRSLSPGRLRAIAAQVRAVAGDSNARRRFDPAVDGLFSSADRLEAVLAARRETRIRPSSAPDLDELLAVVAHRLGEVERRLREDDGSGARQSGATEASARATRALQTVATLRGDCAHLAEPGADEVVYVSGSTRPALTLAPIDVAPHLAAALFARGPVVLTSATIPPRLAARVGAPESETDEIDVGSPFDYEHHALLYCAAHVPDRRRADAEAVALEELCALIEAAGGRTLALFTSHAAMQRAADAVRGRVAFPILLQGERGKSALLDAFAAEEGACLFATMGFWQGVDVAGATLSLVVIDRLPFGRPDDPLLVARRDRAGRDAFRVVDLPRAASLLAQGAGRLVRSASDRGVVAVLDPRLATASYRWDLVRALPPMHRTRRREEAEEFLRTLRGAAPTGAIDGEPADGAARPGERDGAPATPERRTVGPLR